MPGSGEPGRTDPAAHRETLPAPETADPRALPTATPCPEAAPALQLRARAGRGPSEGPPQQWNSASPANPRQSPAESRTTPSFRRSVRPAEGLGEGRIGGAARPTCARQGAGGTAGGKDAPKDS